MDLNKHSGCEMYRKHLYTNTVVLAGIWKRLAIYYKNNVKETV